MNSEQQEKLIQFLAAAGFAGEELEQQLKANIKLNVPRFSIRHAISYGEETMFFDLRFQMVLQFDAYRLESYTATHRKPLLIKHEVVNGVDTAQLEQKMTMHDWDAYFGKRITDPLVNEAMAETAMALNRLPLGQHSDGMRIQEELMFKYWPAEIYDKVATQHLRPVYECAREFTATETGLCHANLAYHILSGRLDDLYEKLSFAGLDNLLGLDLHARLEAILSGDPDTFDLKYSRNEPDGLAEYIFPVSKIYGWYSVDTYSLTLTPYPEIEHGNFNGIDTRELEAMMREIDWRNDRELFIFREDAEPDFFPDVSDVQEQVYRLGQDMAGSEIAELLQLKYWQDATFFSDVIPQTAWDTLAELPKRTEVFPIETDATIALNLLHGRAVMDSPPYLLPPDDASTWLRLDLDKRDQNGHYPVQKIEGFGKQELNQLLELLPVSPADFYPVRNSLLRGDVSPVTFRNDVKVLLEANPEQRTINITTSGGRPIHFNFRFDPDWKPDLKSQQMDEKKQQEHQQKCHRFATNRPRKNNRGKGKGI